jgi:RNA polymerase sigma-70 factor (ECF subfamily)
MGGSGRPETEAEIARLLDAGDLRAAATVLIRDYGPEINGYLFVVLRDGDRTNDAFSRFSEDVWKGIGGFRRECSARSWAYRVAFNAANDELADTFRKRGRRLLTEEISELVAEVRSSSLEFFEEARRKLDSLRAMLTPEEQTLLTLRKDRRLSWRDVAHVFATAEKAPNEAAVRKRFERLVDKLRTLAGEDDDEDDDE